MFCIYFSTFEKLANGKISGKTKYNLLFIAISGPDNHGLLSCRYIVCAGQVFQLVYQTHKLKFRMPDLLGHCTFEF